MKTLTAVACAGVQLTLLWHAQTVVNNSLPDRYSLVCIPGIEEMTLQVLGAALNSGGILHQAIDIMPAGHAGTATALSADRVY